jgi:plastocyanin
MPSFATATVAVMVAAAALTGCGGDGYGQSPTTPGTVVPPVTDGRTITTSAQTFGPAALTVKVGDAVTFAFGQVAHNVFFDVAAGAPANIEGENAGVTVTRVFTTAGSYHYNCHIHAGMQGTVLVN